MVQITLATQTYFYGKQTRIKLKHLKDDFNNYLKSMKTNSKYFNTYSCLSQILLLQKISGTVENKLALQE